MDSTDQLQNFDTSWIEAAFTYPGLPMEVQSTDSISQSGKEITETFLNQSGIEIAKELLVTTNLVWVSYLVMGMLAVIAVLWYFVPDRVMSVFYVPELSKKSRSKDVALYSPGLVINVILSLNFVMAFSIFGFFIVKYYFPYVVKGYSQFQVMAAIASLILLIYFFKYFLISIIGFIFDTGQASKYQKRIFSNTNNLLGILLLPLLFFLTNWNEPYLLIAGIILVISAQILKWYSTFFIVISLPGIFVFHFIVYLCTLEFIPLVVLIKLLNSGLA